MTFWHKIRGFSIGCLIVSAFNLMVVEMNVVLWIFLTVNVGLFLVSTYKIWKGK